MKLLRNNAKIKKENIDKTSFNVELEEKLLQFTNLMIYIAHDKESEFLAEENKKKVQ